MTPQKNLELRGNLERHPFAELLVETSGAKLNGSLRVTCESQKAVVYFSGGSVAFAVSNAREFRLFDMLLRQKKIDKKFLAKHPNFPNDIEFAEALRTTRALSNEEIGSLFTEQIEGILIDVLSWPGGEWIFDPLARLRGDLRFEINIHRLLIEYARCLPGGFVVPRFKSREESFFLAADADPAIDLQPHEAFVLSRFDTTAPLNVEEIMILSGLPESQTLQTLYALWLGGFLLRRQWNAAFSEKRISKILGTHVELVKGAQKLAWRRNVSEMPLVIEEMPARIIEVRPKTEEKQISLEEYLDRVETAETHYDILGLPLKAELSEIKQSYFALARMFHPDRYHKEGGSKLRRIQNAFTGLALAHETLKHPESREAYDFKMRKELAAREKLRAAGGTGDELHRQLQTDQAAENFDKGFSYLMEDEYEAAIPYFIRAVHFAPDIARYHAYYGKALSIDEGQKHKAESEMQTAIRLEPENPTFRLMLTEFFIQIGLPKRAEGELARLLKAHPSHKEARTLLDSLQKK